MDLEPGDPRVSLHVGAFSPIERLVLLAAPGVYAGDQSAALFPYLSINC